MLYFIKIQIKNGHKSEHEFGWNSVRMCLRSSQIHDRKWSQIWIWNWLIFASEIDLISRHDIWASFSSIFFGSIFGSKISAISGHHVSSKSGSISDQNWLKYNVRIWFRSCQLRTWKWFLHLNLDPFSDRNLAKIQKSLHILNSALLNFFLLLRAYFMFVAITSISFLQNTFHVWNRTFFDPFSLLRTFFLLWMLPSSIPFIHVLANPLHVWNSSFLSPFSSSSWEKPFHRITHSIG